VRKCSEQYSHVVLADMLNIVCLKDKSLNALALIVTFHFAQPWKIRQLFNNSEWECLNLRHFSTSISATLKQLTSFLIWFCTLITVSEHQPHLQQLLFYFRSWWVVGGGGWCFIVPVMEFRSSSKSSTIWGNVDSHYIVIFLCYSKACQVRKTLPKPTPTKIETAIS